MGSSHFETFNHSPWLTCATLQHALEYSQTEDTAHLWRVFNRVRWFLSIFLLALQLFLIPSLGVPLLGVPLLLCVLYFLTASYVNLRLAPQFFTFRLNSGWVLTIGLDVFVFYVLDIYQGGLIDYKALMAFPILMTVALGSLQLALILTACIVALLAYLTVWQTDFVWHILLHDIVKTLVVGLGFVTLAVLSGFLVARLKFERSRATLNQLAAQLQIKINDFIISSLEQEVMIVNVEGVLFSANPASQKAMGFNLHEKHVKHPSLAQWPPLQNLVTQTFNQKSNQTVEIMLGEGSRRFRAQTYLISLPEINKKELCAIFMQDQREIDSKIHRDKLVDMGRLSAAVAHDIRNPLSAITQAAALILEANEKEKNISGEQQQLIHIISNNAKRIAKTVDDILEAVQAPLSDSPPPHLLLPESAQAIINEWQGNSMNEPLLLWDSSPLDKTNTPSLSYRVTFRYAHLQRVLFNLLDNAKRYTSGKANSIQVSFQKEQDGVSLSIWSDGAALNDAVKQHMFEPFYSSQSTSSGLGLYICRELCSRYGAHIHHRRTFKKIKEDGSTIEGNEFTITFQPE